MIDDRDPQPAPGAPVPLDLRAIARALATLEDTAEDDRARMDLVRDLEVLTCAATGAQAALSVDFETSQLAAQAAAGTRATEQGRGIAGQVGLARRESINRAASHLSLARTVMGDLPHLAAAWRAGRVSEYRLQLIVKHATCLTRPDRVLFDERMAGSSARVEVLERMGDRRADNDAAQVAHDLDRHAFTGRRHRAAGDRHTRLRRAADGMVWFSALVPLKDGVAMHQSLAAAATTARNARGDDRTKAQVMADTLVDRVTGRTEDTPIPVHLEIVVPVDVATGVGEHADTACWAPAYGPVPADVAREWAEDAAGSGAATYTRIWADAPTGQVIGTESTSQARTYPPALARHARRRDQVCRIPWCDAPVAHIDHCVPAAEGGATSIQNSGGLCEAHNYAKEALGWTAVTSRDPDGTHVITYTTPTGHTYDSRPPPAYPPRE